MALARVGLREVNGGVGSSVVRAPWARPVAEENRSRARSRAPRPGSHSCGVAVRAWHVVHALCGICVFSPSFFDVRYVSLYYARGT